MARNGLPGGSANPSEPHVHLVWVAYVLRERAVRLGVVEGADHDEALRSAIKKFQVPRLDQWRVSVRLISAPR